METNHARRSLIRAAAAGLAGLVSVSSVQAQADGGAPIRIIVPVGAGGLNDMLARMLADHLTIALKRTVIVENKVGANGSIAAAFVARAQPDGNTLLLGASQMAGSVSLYKKLPYSLTDDLAPVAVLAKTPYFLSVSTAMDVRSVADLIAAARQKPGVLTFASTGVGSGSHLVSESFQQSAGVKLLHVPFNSAGQAAVEIGSGRVNMMFSGMPIVQSHVKAGKMRILAAISPEPSEFAPEVPAVGKSGGPTMDATAWFGLFAPTGTDPAIIERLNRVSTDYVNQPDTARRLFEMGAIPQRATPAQFARLIAHSIEETAQIVKRAGIEPQ